MAISLVNPTVDVPSSLPSGEEGTHRERSERCRGDGVSSATRQSAAGRGFRAKTPVRREAPLVLREAAVPGGIAPALRAPDGIQAAAGAHIGLHGAGGTPGALYFLRIWNVNCF